MTDTQYMFSRVPGYPNYTGDKRVWADQRRKSFVCFVVDLKSLRGVGFEGETLEVVKQAADHFAAHYEFPNGAKV